MQITVANAIQRTRCVTAVLEVREDMQIYSGDTSKLSVFILLDVRQDIITEQILVLICPEAFCGHFTSEGVDF